MAAPEDDPDDDSVDGDEAIEETWEERPRDDHQRAEERKTPGRTLDESNRVVDAMLARMEEAARLDDEALKAETPATQKAALMTEVVEFVRKRCAAAAAAAQFSQRAILPTRRNSPARRAIRRERGPAALSGTSTSACSTAACSSGCASGSSRLPAPSSTCTCAAASELNALNMFEVDDVLQSALDEPVGARRSGATSNCSASTRRRRRRTGMLATALVEKWLRRIFGNSAEFRSSDVPMYRPKQAPKDLHAMRDAGAAAGAPSKKDDEANANLQFSRQGLDKGIIPA